MGRARLLSVIVGPEVPRKGEAMGEAGMSSGLPPHAGLVGLRDFGQRAADEHRARVTAPGAGFRGLEELVAAETEAELYDLAVTSGVVTAAAKAATTLLAGLSGSGTHNEHDRATRRALARAALGGVLRALPAAGLTDEQVGALLLRGGRL